MMMGVVGCQCQLSVGHEKLTTLNLLLVFREQVKFTN
jgi:hypothetical protein